MRYQPRLYVTYHRLRIMAVDFASLELTGLWQSVKEMDFQRARKKRGTSAGTRMRLCPERILRLES